MIVSPSTSTLSGGSLERRVRESIPSRSRLADGFIPGASCSTSVVYSMCPPRPTLLAYPPSHWGSPQAPGGHRHVVSGFQPRTANKRHMPGRPLSSCSPRSTKWRSDPTTRSTTVRDTSTTPDAALA